MSDALRTGSSRRFPPIGASRVVPSRQHHVATTVSHANTRKPSGKRRHGVPRGDLTCARRRPNIGRHGQPADSAINIGGGPVRRRATTRARYLRNLNPVVIVGRPGGAALRRLWLLTPWRLTGRFHRLTSTPAPGRSSRGGLATSTVRPHHLSGHVTCPAKSRAAGHGRARSSRRGPSPARSVAHRPRPAPRPARPNGTPR